MAKSQDMRFILSPTSRGFRKPSIFTLWNNKTQWKITTRGIFYLHFFFFFVVSGKPFCLTKEDILSPDEFVLNEETYEEVKDEAAVTER